MDNEQFSQFADRIIASTPTQEVLTFRLVFGLLTADDDKFYDEQCGAGFVHIGIAKTFTYLTGKPFSEFSEDDIRPSLFLANLLVVKAFYERKSVAMGIGTLDSKTLDKLVTAVKLMGYQIDVIALAVSDDEIRQTWQSLNDTQKWQLSQRDYLSADAVLYGLEDVAGHDVEYFMALQDKADISLVSPDGVQMGKLAKHDE